MKGDIKHSTLHYNCLYFSISIKEEYKALEVTFKNRWSEGIFNLYAKVITEFIRKVDTADYTLVLNPVEFKIYIPELKAIIGDFLKLYKEAGFKYIRLATLPPQKEFRKVIKKEGDKVGFKTEFCDLNFNKYKTNEIH